MPCVYTAFKFLFWTAPNLETNGDVFSRLILAIEFNSSAEKIDAQSVLKRLPAFANNNNLSKSSSTKQTNVNTKQSAKMPVAAQKTIYNVRPPSKQTQTDFVNSETLRRVETILYGPHSGAFCQIMDIFVSGYGKVNIDSDLLSVRLVHFIIVIVYKFLSSENKMSNIKTKKSTKFRVCTLNWLILQELIDVVIVGNRDDSLI